MDQKETSVVEEMDAVPAGTSGQIRATLDVLRERARQDGKWGEQNHDPILWSAILTEEVGEYTQAALHHRFGGHKAVKLRDEAVQVAAVALAIIECIDRNGLLDDRLSVAGPSGGGSGAG
jgi:NTP pyrophosphatase (non-canonical NTP hydrolase)